MTAFDTAWVLLKMPIVPGSIERDDEGEVLQHASQYAHEQAGDYPIAMWNAKFEHPDTGEIHPMQWRALLNRYVVDKDFTPHFSGNIGYDKSQVNVHNQIYTEPEERKFVVTSANTAHEHRRKGMATALYEMIARILSDSNARLMRTKDSQTGAAQKLWGDKTEWPVRDDL